MMHNPKTALLLINLGTPHSPKIKDVRRYLRQFLSDPRVIDIPTFWRVLLLNLVILPLRPPKSARAYAKIFTERGSPLLYHGQDLAQKVQQRLEGEGVEVELAMRYGNPSIASTLDALRERGVERLVVLPLYPQYADSTTGSTIEALTQAVAARWAIPDLHFIPPFYDHPAFIEAVAAQARPILQSGRWDRVLFSFHGLPERHLHKADATGSHCLMRDDCCQEIREVNRDCYRAQCVATMQALGHALGVSAEERVLCFQSRLGRTPWIRPYTDEVLAELADQGVKRLAVLTPAFVADCLETLEEIGMHAREEWLERGGEAFELVPCVNASDSWADGVVTISRPQLGMSVPR
ncbi:MAG: ferrochelatase [Deltaproteobacteria bacterium]|nr:ferrochelatase [Deltaproteobacteria bacterium]